MGPVVRSCMARKRVQQRFDEVCGRVTWPASMRTVGVCSISTYRQGGFSGARTSGVCGPVFYVLIFDASSRLCSCTTRASLRLRCASAAYDSPQRLEHWPM